MTSQVDPHGHAEPHDCQGCGPRSRLVDDCGASRLLMLLTVGGLVVGTFGTFHAVTSLAFGGSASGHEFVSARLEALHHLALVTIVCSQVLQLIGSVALWRRRLIGRTLLLTYAAIYLAALILLQSMRAINTASLLDSESAAHRVIIAVSEMHLVVYGSLFPLFLATMLTRPWIVKFLRRKGEPLPQPQPATPPQHGSPSEPRLAA